MLCSLAEKAGTLRLQLGLPDDRTLTETVDEAVTQLGLAKEVAGLTLIQKADACISTMMGSAPVQAVAMVMSVAPIAPIAPVAPIAPSVDVPAMAARREPVPVRDAELYCGRVRPENAAASAHAGCREVRCVDCPSVPCAYAYGINPCGECLCFPLICILLPIPCICTPICPIPFFLTFAGAVAPNGTGGRSGNQFMQYDDNGRVVGAWVIVDEEKKTLAMYDGTIACTTGLNEYPDCLCELLVD